MIEVMKVAVPQVLLNRKISCILVSRPTCEVVFSSGVLSLAPSMILSGKYRRLSPKGQRVLCADDTLPSRVGFLMCFIPRSCATVPVRVESSLNDHPRSCPCRPFLALAFTMRGMTGCYRIWLSPKFKAMKPRACI